MGPVHVYHSEQADRADHTAIDFLSRHADA